MTSEATIESLATIDAPDVVTSDWIEKQFADTLERLGVPFGILEGLTGIKERRVWPIDVRYYKEAVKVAEKAIEKANIDPQEIGCLINASVCRDYIEPSQASLVHGDMYGGEGLSPDCLNFDVTNACLSFVNAMDIMRLLIDAGRVKYGLIVSCEGSRYALDSTLELLSKPDCDMQTFRDNFALLTIGSANVAMVMGHKFVSQTGHIMNGSVTTASTANDHNKLCLAETDHSRMYADPQALQKAGMPLAITNWEKASKFFKNPLWSEPTIDHYCPHQTSTRQVGAFIKNLNLSREKFHLNLQTYGNTVAAALPMSLHQAQESGCLNEGDHVALMGIGSGINCTMMSVSW